MKGIRRWKLAQKREVAISRPKSCYARSEEDQLRQLWLRQSQASRESYVEERLGMRLLALQGMCIMEIGGILFADQLLFGTKTRHKLALDPLTCARISDDCEFIKGVAEYVPQKSSTLDICWMTNTIDHCADPLSALVEIRRVLADGGRLFITCNTFASWTRPFFPIFDYLDRPHPHHFTRSSLLRLLRKAGFTVEVELRPLTHPLRGWDMRFPTLKRLLGVIAGLRQIQVRCYVAKMC